MLPLRNQLYEWATDLHIHGSFKEARLLDKALNQLDELSRWKNGLRQEAIEELVYVADICGHAMPLHVQERLATAFSVLCVSIPFESTETSRDIALGLIEALDPVVLEEVRQQLNQEGKTDEQRKNQH